MARASDRLSHDPAVRLRPFVERGLIGEIPTPWQLVQGQLEMLPYVVLPDPADGERYAGTALGNPLLRQPVLVWEIGLDHFRAGHGLHTGRVSQYKHLNMVSHEGFPTYDLQLIQTMPDGLEGFRSFTQEIEDGASPEHSRLRTLIDLIIPDASRYRRGFLEPGGFIDRAAAFDYPSTDEIPAILRPEFATLVGFVNHCARAYPRRPLDTPPHRLPGHLARIALRKLSDARA